MRDILIFFVAVVVACVGCSSHRSTTTQEHAILKTLAMRDRNAVHVALWTLEQNAIPISPSISLDAPYSQVQPRIQAIRERLQTLPPERLSALDKSLADHWLIYSPIWSSHDWLW